MITAEGLFSQELGKYKISQDPELPKRKKCELNSR